MADGNRVVVYYQTQYDHSLPPDTPYGHYVSPLPLLQLITHLIVAAFHLNLDSKPAKLTLNDNVPSDVYYDQMWQDVRKLQNGGVKVMGMLGGAAPGTYDCLTPDQFETFYPLLRDVIHKYNLDGMDLDVEQATSLSDIERLIKQLKKDFGKSFIITLAPVASALQEGANPSGFDYISLEQRLSSSISFYNAQFYSGFGSVFPDDQYINITTYDGGIIHPSRLVATVLTNGDDGSGYVPPDEVVSSLQALVGKYGREFGGVAGWEYFNSLPREGEPWKWAELMRDTMRGALEKKGKGDGMGKSDKKGDGNAKKKGDTKQLVPGLLARSVRDGGDVNVKKLGKRKAGGKKSKSRSKSHGHGKKDDGKNKKKNGKKHGEGKKEKGKGQKDHEDSLLPILFR